MFSVRLFLVYFITNGEIFFQVSTSSLNPSENKNMFPSGVLFGNFKTVNLLSFPSEIMSKLDGMLTACKVVKCSSQDFKQAVI